MRGSYLKIASILLAANLLSNINLEELKFNSFAISAAQANEDTVILASSYEEFLMTFKSLARELDPIKYQRLAKDIYILDLHKMSLREYLKLESNYQNALIISIPVSRIDHHWMTLPLIDVIDLDETNSSAKATFSNIGEEINGKSVSEIRNAAQEVDAALRDKIDAFLLKASRSEKIFFEGMQKYFRDEGEEYYKNFDRSFESIRNAPTGGVSSHIDTSKAESSQPPTRAVRERNQYGAQFDIEELLGDKKIRKARARDIISWHQKATEVRRANGIYSEFEFVPGRQVFVVLDRVTLPLNLMDERATAFIVPADVPDPTRQDRYPIVYYMKDGSCEGPTSLCR